MVPIFEMMQKDEAIPGREDAVDGIMFYVYMRAPAKSMCVTTEGNSLWEQVRMLLRILMN